jgi:hypothetical protein
MVPFSFKSELSYSRVMKIQLLPSVTVEDRHQPMIGTRESIGGDRESRDDREGGNSQLLSPKFWLLAPDLSEFKVNQASKPQQIRENQSKSNLFFLSSHADSLTPKFWPSLCSFRFRLHVPAWRFRVSAARVFDAGARRTTAGAAVLPKTKMGPASCWSRWLKTQKLQNKANCKNQINYTNTITCANFCFKKHQKTNPICIAKAPPHPFMFGLRRQVAAFPRRDMSRRSKAQSCLRTPQRAHSLSIASRASNVLRMGFAILLR